MLTILRQIGISASFWLASAMNEKLSLCGILSTQVNDVWQFIKENIASALNYADDKYSVDDILGFIRDKKMQLWVVIDQDFAIHASIVTQIVNYPRKKVMLIVIVAGVKLNEWEHIIRNLVQYAKSHDCHSIEAFGRSGWEKKVKHLGFTKIHTYYKLPI